MKILMATDGSDFSRQAIEKACEILAGGGGVRIEIVSVYEEVAYAATEPFMISAEYIEEMERSGRERAAKFAGEAEQTIRGCFADEPIQVTTKILRGAPARAIVEEAENWNADLIVVGSHGDGFWKRTFLGSTSDKLIHHAPCSVLVVRGENNARNQA